MIDLNKLGEKCFEIQEKRKKNGAQFESNILKHIATEVVEAVEAKVWLSNANDSDYKVLKQDYSEELADIIICVLIAAKDYDINIEDAIIGKIEKNRRRAEMQGDKI